MLPSFIFKQTQIQYNMKKRIVKIKNEKDFNKLNFLPFNREYSIRPDLKKRMEKFGFQGSISLIKTDLFSGKEELYIADGQHRAATARHIGLEFTGEIVDYEFENKEEIVSYVAGINSSQKPWGNEEYVIVYSKLGKDDYTYALREKERWSKIASKNKNIASYSIDTIVGLLSNARCTGHRKHALKHGLFEVTHASETRGTLMHAKELSKYCKVSSKMVLALQYARSSEGFNEKRFNKNYILNAQNLIERKADFGDYINTFIMWGIK